MFSLPQKWPKEMGSFWKVRVTSQTVWAISEVRDPEV